jgi:hypothetical protein
MNVAYSSEDCNVFSAALDYAWDLFLKTNKLTSDNIDTAKAALTYAILHSARGGERNPRRLAVSAVARIESFQPAIQMQRSWSRPNDAPKKPIAEASASASPR